LVKRNFPTFGRRKTTLSAANGRGRKDAKDKVPERENKKGCRGSPFNDLRAPVLKSGIS